MPDHSPFDASRPPRSSRGRRSGHRRPPRRAYRHGTPPRHPLLPPLPRAYLTRAGVAAVAVACLVLGPGIAQSAVQAHDAVRPGAGSDHRPRHHAASATPSGTAAPTAAPDPTHVRTPAHRHTHAAPTRTRSASPTRSSATPSRSAEPTKRGHHRGHGHGSSRTTPGDDGTAAIVADVVRRTNAEREAAGCSALSVDDRLVRAAQEHSDDMAEHQYFDHDSPDGRTPFDRMDDAGYDYTLAAENIAAGQPDAAAVVDGWMNSPGHRMNMLNCAYTDVGVGYATTDQGYGTYWTMDLGRPV